MADSETNDPQNAAVAYLAVRMRDVAIQSSVDAFIKTSDALMNHWEATGVSTEQETSLDTILTKTHDALIAIKENLHDEDMASIPVSQEMQQFESHYDAFRTKLRELSNYLEGLDTLDDKLHVKAIINLDKNLPARASNQDQGDIAFNLDQAIDISPHEAIDGALSELLAQETSSDLAPENETESPSSPMPDDDSDLEIPHFGSDWKTPPSTHHTQPSTPQASTGWTIPPEAAEASAEVYEGDEIPEFLTRSEREHKGSVAEKVKSLLSSFGK